VYPKCSLAATLACCQTDTYANLQLQHEDSLEDLSNISKGDAGLLGVQVFREELQPELEDAGPAKGCLLAGDCHMLLYTQALQHLCIQTRKIELLEQRQHSPRLNMRSLLKGCLLSKHLYMLFYTQALQHLYAVDDVTAGKGCSLLLSRLWNN